MDLNPAHATIKKLLSPPVDVLLRPKGGWKRPDDLLGALAPRARRGARAQGAQPHAQPMRQSSGGGRAQEPQVNALSAEELCLES